MSKKAPAEQKEVDVKDIPGLSEIYGKKQTKIDIFEPKDLFDKLKVPEEYRYRLTLSCLSDGDKSLLLQLVKRAQIDAVMWCKKNGVDMSHSSEDAISLKDKTIEEINEISANNILLSKKCQEATPRFENYSIIQKYVIGLDGYRDPSTLKHIKFSKENRNVKYIKKELWDTIPSRVKEEVYNRLLKISNVTDWETINL